MKRIGFFYIIGILSCICAVSCVKDIIMDAQEKPQVAVVCIMTDNPVQEMSLFLTKGASLKEPVPVTEAEAVLTDLSWGEETGHFERRGEVWTLAYTPIPRHRYKLEVSVPGYDKITAEQEMPEPVQMVARANYYYRIEGLHYPGSLIEPGPFVPNAEDFDSLPLGAKSYYIRTLPASLWLFARNYDPTSGRHVTAERICCNYPYTDPFNVTGEQYVPPHRTDIPNPYMEGSHVAELYPALAGSALHDKYLRFPARDLSDVKGIWFKVSGSMDGKYNCKDFYQYYYHDTGLASPLQPDEGYLVATTVSKDLDTYLLDAYPKMGIKTSTDLSTIYLRDNLFTNIAGGVGIFGGMCSRYYQWSGEYEYVDDGIDHKEFEYYYPDEQWPL